MSFSQGKTARLKVKVHWYRQLNFSLLLGVLIALLINGAFIFWLMEQPLPPIFFQLATNMNALFKPAPSPCPPFESTSVIDVHGKVTENQYTVPTFLVPHNRIPFPRFNRESVLPLSTPPLKTITNTKSEASK